MSFSDLVSGKWCIMLISLLPGGLLFGSVVSQLRSGERETGKWACKTLNRDMSNTNILYKCFSYLMHRNKCVSILN